MRVKYLLCMLGIILTVPFLAVLIMATILPITSSGIGYLLTLFLMIAGLIMALKVQRYYLVITAGLVVFILIVSTRIVMGKSNSPSAVNMITLPQQKGMRELNYILDEQDSLIFGEMLFHLIGGSSTEEHDGITQALYQDYSEIGRSQKIIPSPIINTYLGLQSPNAFDVVVIKPDVNRHPHVGVLFLHGFMGNVTAQCWEIAQAASQVGMTTVCPSTDRQGRWWEPRGEAILESTFEYLKLQGINKIYLGGFSNGGFGISRLAAQMMNKEELVGIFLIDGFTNGREVAKIGVPVLIIQGTSDERVPVSAGRQFADEIGSVGTYEEMEGDHFLIMKQPAQVQNIISTWLASQMGE